MLVLCADPNLVTLDVVYTSSFNGPSSITEHYRITPSQIELSYALAGYSNAARIVFPVLTDDGAETSNVTVGSTSITVDMPSRGPSNTFTAVGSSSVWLDNTVYSNKNGYNKIGYAEFNSGVTPELIIGN